jgi:mRNA interferase RelE/StbE
LTWKVEVTPAAAKQIRGLGHVNSARVLAYLRERLAKLDEPRQAGKHLTGSTLGEFWRYRVGDLRVLCHLQDEVLVILVVEVGHRREVYR